MGRGTHIPILSKRVSRTSSTPEWRPFYLRGSILLAFGIFFALLIIIIQVLLDVSNRNHGLAASYTGLHYLWTYGPTAILTLLAAFWTRVEYQTKLTTPWLSMYKGPCEASKSVQLDYISMLQPMTIFRALRNRHYAVFAATLISLTIRISIPISTALITLAPTSVFRTDMPLVLKSEFVDSPAKLRQNSGLAAYTLSGATETNNYMPDGVSSEYAYQLVELGSQASQSFTAKVDGLSAGLTCESAQMTDVPSNITPYKVGSTYSMNPDKRGLVASEQCKLSVEYAIPTVNFTGDLGQGYQLRDFGRLMPGNCTGSSDYSDQRVSIVFGTMNFTVDKTSEDEMEILDVSIIRSNALICTPTYEIRTVDLIQEANSTRVFTPDDTSTRQLSNVHAWDIMQAHLDSTDYNGGGIDLDFAVDQDGYVGLAASFAAANMSLPSIDSLFQPDGAQDFMTKYYQQFVAVLAHNSLMEPASASSTASGWVLEDRLIVRSIVAHWMTGLFVVAIVLTIAVRAAFPRHTFLPRNPGSIVGTAALLSRSYPFVYSFRHMGAANLRQINRLTDANHYELSNRKDGSRENDFSIVAHRQLPEYGYLAPPRVERTEWRPITLHPAYRLSIYAILIAIFAALEITLQKSLRENGLGDVGDNSYIHFSWTISPAVLLTLLGMYFAAADFDIRSLAPYFHLCKGASFKSSLSLDLLDSFTLPTIGKEFRSRSFAALAATFAVAFTSFLTIASASLFYTISVPNSWLASLEFNNISEDGITSGFVLQGGGVPASLVLLGNMTYPAFTFENLALPNVSFTANQSESANSTNFLTSAKVPATRSRLTCRVYDASQISTSLNRNTSSDTDQGSSTLTVDIDEEQCLASADTTASTGSEGASSNLVLGVGSSMADTSYFGGCRGEPEHLASTNGDSSRQISGCSELLWIWGHWDTSSTEPITSVSALGCNETIETVEAEWSFLGSDLRIDPVHPPNTDEATSAYLFTPSNRTALALTWSPSDIYTTLVPTYSSTDDLGSCLTLVTNSRYAIPVELLGDSGQASAVADALRFHHGVIRAQSMKPGLDGGAAAEPIVNIETITGKITDPSRRRRVIQDLASTRVLQSLLLATLVGSSLGWIFMRNAKILPRKTTCIASVAALLADGNVFDFLTRDAPWANLDELDRSFGENVVFRLGWRRAGGGSEDCFAVFVDTTTPREVVGTARDGEDESLVRKTHAAPEIITPAEPSRVSSVRTDGYSMVASDDVSAISDDSRLGRQRPGDGVSIEMTSVEHRRLV